MPWRRNRSPRVSPYLEATSDAEGRFVFATVPPGEWKVQRELNKLQEGKVRIRVSAYSHGVPVTLRAGETATVTLGGSGRAVIGRAVAPESLGADVWTENSVALILKVPTPGAPQAPNSTTSPQPRNFRPPTKNIRERAWPTGIPKTV